MTLLSILSDCSIPHVNTSPGRDLARGRARTGCCKECGKGDIMLLALTFPDIHTHVGWGSRSVQGRVSPVLASETALAQGGSAQPSRRAAGFQRSASSHARGSRHTTQCAARLRKAAAAAPAHAARCRAWTLRTAGTCTETLLHRLVHASTKALVICGRNGLAKHVRSGS